MKRMCRGKGRPRRDTIHVRLDAKTVMALDRLAKKTDMSRSQVVRELMSLGVKELLCGLQSRVC